MALSTSPRRSRYQRTALGGPVQGWLYAAPTALFVIALFVIPLLLVLQMSGSDWPLLRGNTGPNFPRTSWMP